MNNQRVISRCSIPPVRDSTHIHSTAGVSTRSCSSGYLLPSLSSSSLDDCVNSSISIRVCENTTKPAPLLSRGPSSERSGRQPLYYVPPASLDKTTAGQSRFPISRSFYLLRARFLTRSSSGLITLARNRFVRSRRFYLHTTHYPALFLPPHPPTQP